jgi:hypothetical protein
MIFLVSFAKVLQWKNNYKTANLGGNPSVINCWFSHHNYKGASVEQAPPNIVPGTGMTSTEIGLIHALAALKAAIQASPSFNVEALEQIAQTVADNPPPGVDKELFQRPIRFLIGNQDSLLQGFIADRSRPPSI